MAEEIQIKGIVIMAVCSDEKIRQIIISKEEQEMWLGVLGKYYNPLKIASEPIETIAIKSI
jgi:hypothetical protein